MRPDQWIKNLMVLVAPVAAGELATPGALTAATLAFWAFTVTAGGVYLLNDVLDRHADIRHPDKCHRPVACGQVTPSIALVTSIALLAGPIFVLALAGQGSLAAVLALFVAVNAAYNMGLKHRAYTDVAAVSASHLLRAVGGAVAVGVALPPLLAAVIMSAALHLVASKRLAELRDLGAAGGTRPVLARYSSPMLQQLRVASAVAALGAYATWALSHAALGSGLWFLVSVLPVVVGYRRFDQVVADGAGERPERLLVRDTTLITSALCAVVVLGVAAHV